MPTSKPVRGVVVLIHGTYASAAGWPSRGPLRDSLIETLGDDVVIETFGWTGKNNYRDRAVAGDVLGQRIDEWSSKYIAADGRAAPVLLVGHSHGGNVALYADSDARTSIKGIICLGTPFVHSRQFDFPARTLGQCVCHVATAIVVALVAAFLAWLTHQVASQWGWMPWELCVLAGSAFALLAWPFFYQLLQECVGDVGRQFIERQTEYGRRESCQLTAETSKPLLVCATGGDEAYMWLRFLDKIAYAPVRLFTKPLLLAANVTLLAGLATLMLYPEVRAGTRIDDLAMPHAGRLSPLNPIDSVIRPIWTSRREGRYSFVAGIIDASDGQPTGLRFTRIRSRPSPEIAKSRPGDLAINWLQGIPEDGDRITAIDGQPVGSLMAVYELAAASLSSAPWTVTTMRGSVRKDLAATFRYSLSVRRLPEKPLPARGLARLETMSENLNRDWVLTPQSQQISDQSKLRSIVVWARESDVAAVLSFIISLLAAALLAFVAASLAVLGITLVALAIAVPLLWSLKRLFLGRFFLGTQSLRVALTTETWVEPTPAHTTSIDRAGFVIPRGGFRLRHSAIHGDPDVIAAVVKRAVAWLRRPVGR